MTITIAKEKPTTPTDQHGRVRSVGSLSFNQHALRKSATQVTILAVPLTLAGTLINSLLGVAIGSVGLGIVITLLLLARSLKSAADKAPTTK